MLLAGLSTNANAEFVAGDYLSANNSSVTLESTTGLEWLNLTLTVNKSINDVSALIDSGYLVSMYGARELDLNVFRDYHKTLTPVPTMSI